MYIACPNCKLIKIEWNDSNSIFTNHVIRTANEIGLPCPECFAERKIIHGPAPKTCKHGRPLNCQCRECKAQFEQEDGLDFIAHTGRRK